MMLVAASGTIELANEQLLALFGYSRGELVGQKVELLVPERFRTMHPGLRHCYFCQPDTRRLGIGRELRAMRKDGSEFPVEIGLSPLRTEHGPYVLVSVIDLTERRRTESELRESREQLRQLAGQILGAQETERRRIARELHDDFGQELALLSVELDLLRQRPATSAAEAAARLETMSGRVKQLSSSIHDLSHQLHPMKLEQLGLVAALRAMCHELTTSHDLRIEFAHDELAGSVPHESAICLYRVAQEALHNVVKHSRARRAGVELRLCDGAIRLIVADFGQGFVPAATTGESGLGLASMRERLRLVNGQFTIESEPGRGTRLEARVPLGTPEAANVEWTAVAANSSSPRVPDDSGAGHESAAGAAR
jgi:PAS domain S-box-containing protein